MSGELGALSALEAWFQSFTCGSMCSQDKVEDGKDYSFTPADYDDAPYPPLTTSDGTRASETARIDGAGAVASATPPPSPADRSPPTSAERRRVSWADSGRVAAKPPARPPPPVGAAPASPPSPPPSPPNSPTSPLAPGALTPRAVALLAAAASLGDLPLSAYRDALAPLNGGVNDDGPLALEALIERFARATGLPAGYFSDGWAPSTVLGFDHVAGATYGVCADLGVVDDDVLRLAASGLEFETVARVAALLAPAVAGGDASRVAAELGAAVRRAARSEQVELDRPPHAQLPSGGFSSVVESFLVDEVLAEEARDRNREEEERRSNQRRATEAAATEQRRRSVVATPNAVPSLDDDSTLGSASPVGPRSPSSPSAPPHLAVVDLLVAAARLDASSLGDVCDLLSKGCGAFVCGEDELDAARDRLSTITNLPGAFFTKSFVLGSALDATQVVGFCFATVCAHGASEDQLETMIVDALVGQSLAAIAGRVAPCCGHDHRSGRDAPRLVDELVDAVRGASDLPPGFVNDALVLSVVLSPFQARRVVIDAIVDAERRAEDDHFEAREAEERGANQRAVADAAREEQVRLTEEMDGEFTDDESGSDED